MSRNRGSADRAGFGNAAPERFRERGTRRGDALTSPRRISAIASEGLHGIYDAIRRNKVTYTECQAVEEWLIAVGGERERRVATVHGRLPRGATLVFTGQVLGLTGEPVPFARLDLWHADTDGYYSGCAPTIPAGNLRPVVVTDEHGTFEITKSCRPPTRSRPMAQIPTDGAVGALISSAEWSARWPAHLHLIVSKLSYFPLTTQLYFRVGQWPGNGIAQATKPELILDVAPNPDGVLQTHYDFTFALVQP